MIVYGFDSIAPLLDNDGYLFKLLVNDTGVVLFPHTPNIATRLNPASNTLTIRAATRWLRWSNRDALNFDTIADLQMNV